MNLKISPERHRDTGRVSKQEKNRGTHRAYFHMVHLAFKVTGQIKHSLRLLSVTLCLCGAALAFDAGAGAPDEYAFAVPIEGLGSDALHRVAIPASVYEGAAFADLRDLRVFNGAGEVVPYAFRPVEYTAQQRALVNLPMFPLHGPRDARSEDLDLSFDKSGNHVSVRLQSRAATPGQPVLLGYLIDTSALKTPLIRLDLDWGDARVENLVSARLEAGDDLRVWRPLVADAPVGGLSHAGQRLERKSIELHMQQAKYLRLMWTDPAQPVKLQAIRGLLPETSTPPARAWREIAATPVPGKSGEYAFDLGGRFPLDRLVFNLPQENTIVPVQIASRARPEDKWMPVTRGVLYRMTQNGRELLSPELDIHINSHRYWMLSTDAASGGIGSGTLSMRAGWTPREVVFSARGTGPFRLAYGNARAQPGSLAIETLVPGWRSDGEPRMAVAMTGAAQQLAGESAAQPRIDTKKWSLWAALLAGVAVLAWMAWRLSKQMRAPASK